jgi:hypothetical protein
MKIIRVEWKGGGGNKKRGGVSLIKKRSKGLGI